MAWVASIDKIIQGLGNTSAAVSYSTDDGTGRSQTVNYLARTADELNTTIQNRLDVLQSADDAFGDFASGPFSPPAVTAEPIGGGGAIKVEPPAPTPLQQFQQAMQALNSYQRAIAVGVLASDDAGYLAAVASAKALFSTDFLGQF